MSKSVGAPNSNGIKQKDYVQRFQDGDNDLEMFGFQKSTCKTALTWLGYLMTFGLLRLVYHWYPQLRLHSTHGKCSLRDAEKILVIDKYKGKYKSYFVETVQTKAVHGRRENADENTISYSLSNGSKKEVTQVRTFTCKKVCYIWDDENQKYYKLVGLNHTMQKKDFFKMEGYDSTSRIARYIIYGKNAIDVPLQSIFKLFLLEALTPFYIFQVFSLVVWFAEKYYYYTIAIIVMSIYGISSSIVQTRKNQANLRGTVEMMDEVDVTFDENKAEKIKSTELVPGDIIIISQSGCSMHCDAVLLNGSCIVNESMLTGESVPILKTALQLSDTLYNEKEDSNHTLYCGTTIIQSRTKGDDPVKAVVIRTGYLTSKGELVRSIMYPPPADFKFEKDSYKYIGVLAAIALLGFIYTMVSKSYRHIAVVDTIIKALDIITIIIPPALPAAMTIGKLYALNRLKRKNIFCINSRVINVSGSLTCICFDKTGTLTEDGLDLYGVVSSENIDKHIIEDKKNLNPNQELTNALATCHSLTLINDNLSGDPLDLKMFESTDYVYEHQENSDIDTIIKSNTSDVKLGIIHQNQFSSNLQRMSVVVKNFSNGDLEVYCKGSPEMILKLSEERSVPTSTLTNLKRYTEKGYRVLAIAAKTLKGVSVEDAKKMPRNDIESQLKFMGFLIFENRLKPQSAGVIKTLKDADMKVVMITGDNIQTAMSIAKECGIIEKNSKPVDVEVSTVDKSKDPKIFFNFNDDLLKSNEVDTIHNTTRTKVSLTVTGPNWELIKRYFPEQIPKIVALGAVFARMSSEQKQQLILELQNLGYYVAMCGDGTNDCGALKAAHVGISLSEAEASVASPFTSREPNISCVTEVVKEGRAALVTSFGLFKFMLCYSLTEFISVIVLYGIDSNLTSLQFLFIDICLVLNFASVFGCTEAFDDGLFNKPPYTSLLSFIPVMSLVFHVTFVIVFQIISYYLIQTYEWFVPFVHDPENLNYFASHENYAIFSVSMFQYIITAIVFSKGRPYRKNILTNRYLTSSLFVMIVICSYMTLYPAQWIISVLEMKIAPSMTAGAFILVLALGNFVVAYLFEDFIVDWLLAIKLKPLTGESKKKYLIIESDVKRSGWLYNHKETVITIATRPSGHYNEGFVDERL